MEKERFYVIVVRTLSGLFHGYLKNEVLSDTTGVRDEAWLFDEPEEPTRLALKLEESGHVHFTVETSAGWYIAGYTGWYVTVENRYGMFLGYCSGLGRTHSKHEATVLPDEDAAYRYALEARKLRTREEHRDDTVFFKVLRVDQSQARSSKMSAKELVEFRTCRTCKHTGEPQRSEPCCSCRIGTSYVNGAPTGAAPVTKARTDHWEPDVITSSILAEGRRQGLEEAKADKPLTVEEVLSHPRFAELHLSLSAPDDTWAFAYSTTPPLVLSSKGQGKTMMAAITSALAAEAEKLDERLNQAQQQSTELQYHLKCLREKQ